MAVDWSETATIDTPSFFGGLQARAQQALADQVTPLRLASHLSVLLVAVAVLVFSRVDLPKWDFQIVAMPTVEAPSAGVGGVAARVADIFNADSASALAMATDKQQGVAEQAPLVPFTINPERTRKDIQYYTVKAGDTVLAIADQYDLNPETLQWSNTKIAQNPDLLSIGDEIKILPLDGVLHTIAAGDTLSALAQRYKVSTDEIVAYAGNNLSDSNAPLIIGTDLVIPGGTKPLQSEQQVAAMVAYSSGPRDDALVGSGSFSWPTSGSISQNFWGGHPAIDIAGRTGTSVWAADDGYVVTAGGGWNGGYGNHVIIDHGNGFTTLYAHLNTIFVTPGENVGAGQQIGTLGNTGNSTGPHLHFEIRYQGYARNPYNYLP